MKLGRAAWMRCFELVALAIPLVLLSVCCGAEPNAKALGPSTVEEARGRARLLHEAMHATLQIVHHEYYRDDEGLELPAATMRQVFREVANRQQVELRWLAVNAQAMNADHRPRDEFEREAVTALSAGKDEYEQTHGNVYRLASTVTLSSDCLKCHAPTRNSNQERVAGLIIAIPIKPERREALP